MAGFYAALRQGISHTVDNEKTPGASSSVRLKLFNLLLAELGPCILARGLVLERDEFNELLRYLPIPKNDTLHDTGRILLSATFQGVPQ